MEDNYGQTPRQLQYRRSVEPPPGPKAGVYVSPTKAKRAPDKTPALEPDVASLTIAEADDDVFLESAPSGPATEPGASQDDSTGAGPSAEGGSGAPASEADAGGGDGGEGEDEGEGEDQDFPAEAKGKRASLWGEVKVAVDDAREEEADAGPGGIPKRQSAWGKVADARAKPAPVQAHRRGSIVQRTPSTVLPASKRQSHWKKAPGNLAR